MRDEDIGILNMMQGSTAQVAKTNEDSRKGGTRARTVAASAKALEDIGVTVEEYQSLAFNILPLTKNQRLSVAFMTIAQFHAPGDGYIRTQDEKACLKRFINAAEK